ncbi:ABC-type Mn2+/Zn2+ transport system ATPase subunit [Mumia flava]|uniref:ABC-type Mn2+/Zn2+ transport system ATPase subunit n=1 Tax=Mumia flava TaxID=1348852 RepID=A0A2M9BJZ7_9ACTN|nr:ABC-type Mn2+/Zn2+ transport system ATPase subunit [Mumia flava]
MPGGRPTITYNPREDLNLESQVRRYLADRHTILSVSGPTKTGKTVLLKSLVPDAIWLSGGGISSADEFWQAVGDLLDLPSVIEDSVDQSSTTSGGWTAGAGVAGFKGEHQHADETGSTVGRRSTRKRSIKNLVRENILDDRRPIVIDDFHYIDPGVQLEITRGLKDLVFDGLAVIVASVPHRAFDVVRVEKEMTGRVDQLEVGFWGSDDLRAIATSGFGALRLVDSDGAITNRLIQESFESPHLMQLFCREVCYANDVGEVQDQPRTLLPPEWEEFFRARASDTSKSAFDLLACGPRQRTDRIVRRLTNGQDTDIYGATLTAIAHTGPLTKLTYEQLRSALKEVLDSELPQRHEVTRVLEEMTKIAKERIDGEPVVDYDAELATLFISDPFFAYYLRWGVRPDAST